MTIAEGQKVADEISKADVPQKGQRGVGRGRRRKRKKGRGPLQANKNANARYLLMYVKQQDGIPFI